MSTAPGGFLGLAGRTILVQGVANRRSVAFAASRALLAEGARVVHLVRSAQRREQVAPLLGGTPVLVCDVERPEDLVALGDAVGRDFAPVHGVLHSIAFANYAGGIRPFHETGRADFLQAVQVSAFSLVELVRVLRPHLDPRASIVTVGISSLHLTPDNYGFMGPAKAALESCVRFLAKSLSADSEVRCNCIGAGPLRTSASAGIPGYLESYLYAERMTLRRRALETREVADTALFLLSPRSSGINGTTITVDAGLGQNYFDRELVRLAMRPERPAGGGDAAPA